MVVKSVHTDKHSSRRKVLGKLASQQRHQRDEASDAALPSNAYRYQTEELESQRPQDDAHASLMAEKLCQHAELPVSVSCETSDIGHTGTGTDVVDSLGFALLDAQEAEKYIYQILGLDDLMNY